MTFGDLPGRGYMNVDSQLNVVVHPFTMVSFLQKEAYFAYRDVTPYSGLYM